MATPRPGCPDCETAKLACPNCDDNRPTAEDIDVGWRIWTPFGRWETVEKTHQSNRFGPVLIWTREAGTAQPWRYARVRRLDARAPENPGAGIPEIRVVEDLGAHEPMIAYATFDTNESGFDGGGMLAIANRPDAGGGWQVVHWPGHGEPVHINHPSKAKARAELHRIAADYAEKMNVRVTVQKA